VAGFWECRNEPSRSIKYEKTLRLAGDLLASQEGLWSMDLVGTCLAAPTDFKQTS
jgi:hypothetical protein